MSDSDDSDLDEIPSSTRYKTKYVHENNFPYVHFETPDIIYERWSAIPFEVKKKVGHMLHVAVFWWHILFRQAEKHTTTAWAVEMGFLDSNVSNDLSLKKLDRIETLEHILKAMEKGCLRNDLTKKLILISQAFTMQEDCLAEAIHWLELSEGPKITSRVQTLSPRAVCYGTLHFVFTEYAQYIQAMVYSKKKMMRELSVEPFPWSINKSEEMKIKGNELFQKKKYDVALKLYTKAIKFHSDNHILYGNRALCYIRCEKYLKAVGDGKRAIILQPDWAKGHYRFCDALFFLGEHKRALEANRTAQSLCSEPEGLGNLQQQNARFLAEIEELKDERRSKSTEAKKVSIKRADDTGATNVLPLRADAGRGVEQKTDTRAGKNKESGEKENWQEPSGSGSKTLDSSKDMKSTMADQRTRRTVSSTIEKRTVRIKHQMPQPSVDSPCGKEQLCSSVQDAHTALADQRFRNAEQAFAQSLAIVDNVGLKELGLSDLDKLLLIYGYATALLETGQAEELAKAKKQFSRLTEDGNKFPSLVHFGMGKVLLKENRFSKALEEFDKALLIVKRRGSAGKLTWPTTKVTIEETCPEYLKASLEKSLETCRFSPKPDAICRYQNCLGHSKIAIYFSDPDFKGFIRMRCCHSCSVEFHISCWKKMKTDSYPDRNDKDFLQEICFTPDCGDKICQIVIFDPNGLIKCEFETSVPKNTPSGRLKVKQKCTSLKKLKSKEERKQRRKQRRLEVSSTRPEESDQVARDGAGDGGAAGAGGLPKDRLLYEDRVLQQIDKHRELFKDETDSIKVLMTSLMPWMETEQAEECSDPTQDGPKPQTLNELVDLLLVRKNRVWARVFVQMLCGLNIKPKLLEWAIQLDQAGLKAAEKFIACYVEHLEELELSPVLKFTPLQDVLIERFGAIPDSFASAEFTVTDYVKQAPPKEMRIFIWTLDVYREQYPSCHCILDEYFEMDAICLVIKKTDHEKDTNSHIKSRGSHRKKKQRGAKSFFVLSGMRGGGLRDEEEDMLSDEDSFMPFGSSDPFSVPEHLRDQVAEFEGQYHGRGPLHQYRIITDPTKESLFDYFDQILEEHGPLHASDQLLVGELEHFPPEAQQKIQEAGGLLPFLSESLRFVTMDDCVGLMRHAVPQHHALWDPPDLWAAEEPDDPQRPRPSHLNPTAKEFLPHLENMSLSDNGPFGNAVLMDQEGTADLSVPYPMGADHACFTVPDVSLPNPYALAASSSQHDTYAMGSGDNSISGVAGADGMDYYNSVGAPSLNHGSVNALGPYEGINPHEEDGGAAHSQMVAAAVGEGSVNKSIAVQAFEEIWDDVAVNTEPYATFENSTGNMTKQERNNIVLATQMQRMREDYTTVQQRRADEIANLKADADTMHQQIEITNKELSLFQQKLEEEVKKDQQEKKDNQETLKAMKAEIKELVDVHESYSKDIREKNKVYDTELERFLEISNQSAAEKMSLEDEIKRCRDVTARAAKRSQAAELSILQNRCKRSLRGLNKFVSDGQAILKKMMDASARCPSLALSSAMEAWKASVQEAEENIVSTKVQYEEQMAHVRNGSRLCSLPEIPAPTAPAPPLGPLQYQLPAPGVPTHQLGPQHIQPFVSQLLARPQMFQGASVNQSPDRPAPVQSAAAAVEVFAPKEAAQRPSAAQGAKTSRPLPPQHTVFEKIVERLSSMFPHYSRPVLSKFIQEVRTANGGCLNNLSYEDVINRVAQHILDHQDVTREQINSIGAVVSGSGAHSQSRQTPPLRADSPASGRSSATPPPGHVWKSVSTQIRTNAKALNMEDPCIICHDDMAPEDVCVLECRHSFHRECITPWLKEQSTCPTCREHALLPEDFPMLPGRTRRGQAPATNT